MGSLLECYHASCEEFWPWLRRQGKCRPTAPGYGQHAKSRDNGLLSGDPTAGDIHPASPDMYHLVLVCKVMQDFCHQQYVKDSLQLCSQVWEKQPGVECAAAVPRVTTRKQCRLQWICNPIHGPEGSSTTASIFCAKSAFAAASHGKSTHIPCSWA